MFGLRIITLLLALSRVIVFITGRTVEDNVPQKDIFLIKQFQNEKGAAVEVHELDGIDNNGSDTGSLLVRRLKGETEDDAKGETNETKDLNRNKRGVKKSFKKGGGGGGGGGGKGGCKKGRK